MKNKETLMSSTTLENQEKLLSIWRKLNCRSLEENEYLESFQKNYGFFL